MKNAKKFISILILGCVICTHTYNVYQTCHATEVVVAGGLASVGVALLGLGAVAGVGMELDNNRRFNELSDEEKQRIENGLATDFNDVALQRGASVEHIKNWTTDLCSGVLDKASECWGIFKDWIKSVSISDSWQKPEVVGSYVDIESLIGISGTNSRGNWTITQDTINKIRNSNMKPNNKTCWIVVNEGSSSSFFYTIYGVTSQPSNGVLSGEVRANAWVFNTNNNIYDTYAGTRLNLNGADISGIRSSIPVMRNGYDINGIGGAGDVLFSTNTDYLEKLKGQDEDVIDVIDVTDIKNPIVESRQNSLVNINWNRGTRRTNNNKDDGDNKMVTGLVPMDVWYEQIDDEQEEMQNAVVVYNNYIQEHPEEKDTYFISTTPVTNINNYFNTLPVVNLPTQGTVVNNYYEYNNYNNNNTTIYELPYNTELVPQIPTMIFENKFPFCIPFDIYQFFAMFYVEKEAPHIVVPVPFKGANGVFAEELTIDLSDYNYVSDVLRVMLYLLFIVGLMVATRRLIKG